MYTQINKSIIPTHQLVQLLDAARDLEEGHAEPPLHEAAEVARLLVMNCGVMCLIRFWGVGGVGIRGC